MACRALDLTAPSLASTAVFAKMGCFLHGCCFGPPAPPPLGLPVAEGRAFCTTSRSGWLRTVSAFTASGSDLAACADVGKHSGIDRSGSGSVCCRSYPSGTVSFSISVFSVWHAVVCHFLVLTSPRLFQYYVPFLYLGCVGYAQSGWYW